MTTRKEKALAALLAARNRAQAAKAAGVCEKTLYNYLHKDDEFKTRYREALGNLATDAAAELQKALSPAIGRLVDIINDEEAALSAQVQACRSVLEYHLKLHGLHNHEERLQRLEAAFAQNPPGAEDDEDAGPAAFVPGVDNPEGGAPWGGRLLEGAGATGWAEEVDDSPDAGTPWGGRPLGATGETGWAEEVDTPWDEPRTEDTLAVDAEGHPGAL